MHHLATVLGVVSKGHLRCDCAPDVAHQEFQRG